MKKKLAPKSAEAFLSKSGCIVIRVPIANLPIAVEGYSGMDFGNEPMVVTDAQKFAKEVCRALNDADEQGTSLIHKLFDDAFVAVLEDGGEGVEEAVRCEACSKCVVKANASFDDEDAVWICKPCAKEMADK